LTQAFGINELGQIVGRFRDAGGASHGFLLDGGNFTAIDIPGATHTPMPMGSIVAADRGRFTDAGRLPWLSG
jgi:probable HAF family extracellular repeat protein